jgi:hypothetical protein
MQSEEIPIVHFKSMICPEPTTIDQNDAASTDNQFNVNLIQQLRNYPYRTMTKQATEVVPYHGPEHWDPSIKPSTQPLHRPILESGRISHVRMKAGADIEVDYHKASVDIKSEEDRI